MPAIGELGSSKSSGVHRVRGTQHYRHVGVGEVVVALLELVDDVVRHARLRQEDVQLPRHPPSDGMDPKPDLLARLP